MIKKTEYEYFCKILGKKYFKYFWWATTVRQKFWTCIETEHNRIFLVFFSKSSLKKVFIRNTLYFEEKKISSQACVIDNKANSHNTRNNNIILIKVMKYEIINWSIPAPWKIKNNNCASIYLMLEYTFWTFVFFFSRKYINVISLRITLLFFIRLNWSRNRNILGKWGVDVGPPCHYLAWWAHTDTRYALRGRLRHAPNVTRLAREITSDGQEIVFTTKIYHSWQVGNGKWFLSSVSP